MGEALGLSLYRHALLLLVVVGVIRLLLRILLLRLSCVLCPLLGIGLPILRRQQLSSWRPFVCS